MGTGGSATSLTRRHGRCVSTLGLSILGTSSRGPTQLPQVDIRGDSGLDEGGIKSPGSHSTQRGGAHGPYATRPGRPAQSRRDSGSGVLNGFPSTVPYGTCPTAGRSAKKGHQR